ncbi:methyl-accepting chemotaxis protein [Treponema socranskii]|uniref:Methyl-accepting chemotaxis protein signaling domain protein n=1 Tax=Treponema socranskii subsp. socranskii VPI DR56BR1116 = ATCC 35536 TaxID=1125725 RepID=U2L7L0_TRESO|nr:methyl-accepting chemotaxis protein [Treponema socranskii]ERF61891.1 methyl-accepting chemotaxis protein signaling domain protein [Treponema socranskii subsp. socranskii VPI DR56BR1116 = ATCC 35536]ERK00498.1 methyl-accepting chemotaxis protein signaling domain protein [Treponema socranskii subsp. socranskii VPI DR56BR1116 = ATCC 35536]MDR9859356.1 methyl-accepting chemotaxis protein [Treponema socranskii]
MKYVFSDGKKHKIFSIKNKMITAFAFFSLSIVLISCIVSITLASFSLVRNTRYFLNELVFSSSKALDERSKAMFEKLEAFSNIPDIQEDTLSYRAKIELLKNEIQLQRQRGWLNFGIGGKNGILYRTDNKTENVSREDWFQRAMTGKYAITEPVFSATERMYVSTIAIPLRDLQGKITGVISATLLGGSLSNLVSDMTVGKTGAAYLISPDGIVLGTRQPEILYKNIFTEVFESESKEFQGFLRNALSSGKSKVSISKINNTRYIAATSSMRYSGWTLLLMAPVSEFVAENITTLIRTFILIAALQLVVAIIIGFFIARRIVKPLNLMIDALHNISQGEGDLTIKLPVVGKDETGILSTYFNETISKLRNAIKNVSTGSFEMKTVGSDLESNMVSVSEFVKAITDSIDELRGHFTEQEKSVSETASAIEEVIKAIRALHEDIDRQLSVVQNSTSSLDGITKFVSSVEENIKDAQDTMQNLASATDSGRETLTQANNISQRISEASGSLIEASAVIQNIANQTNLLAMNAAIEAAHAGKAGKGFAVVASEIRKLAESSSAQGKKITTTLKNIIDEIELLASSASGAVEKFNYISNYSNEVHNAIESVVKVMDKQEENSTNIRDMIKNIGTTTSGVKYNSAEMLASSENILTQATQLDELTRVLRKTMDSIESQVDLINSATQESLEIAGKNKESIDGLVTEVGKFKTQTTDI